MNSFRIGVETILNLFYEALISLLNENLCIIFIANYSSGVKCTISIFIKRPNLHYNMASCILSLNLVINMYKQINHVVGRLVIFNKLNNAK